MTMAHGTRQRVMDAIAEEELAPGLRAALLAIAQSIDEGHGRIEQQLNRQAKTATALAIGLTLTMAGALLSMIVG